MMETQLVEMDAGSTDAIVISIKIKLKNKHILRLLIN